MFEQFDEDGNLLLDRDELSKFVKNFFYKFKIEVEMNESQLTACFQEIDVNDDGKIKPTEL